jgi:hypothetical protein
MQVPRLSRRSELAGSIALSAVAFVATYAATINALVFMSHWQ